MLISAKLRDSKKIVRDLTKSPV